MAVIKINDNKTAVTVVGDDGVQYGTSIHYLQGLLAGRSPSGFLELHRYTNKSPEGKWRKSPVLVAGKKIPYEEFYKETNEAKLDQTPSVDLMDKKVRESKRRADSMAVDDNVWQ